MNELCPTAVKNKSTLKTNEKFFEEGRLKPHGGELTIISESSPELSVMQEFERFCMTRFHHQYVSDKVDKLCSNMKDINPQLATDLSVLAADYKEFLQAPKAFETIQPARIEDFATWVKVHGSFKSEKDIDSYIKKLAEFNTAHDYQEAVLGQWSAVDHFSGEIQNKCMTKFAEKQVDDYFTSVANEYSKYEEVTTLTNGDTDAKFKVVGDENGSDEEALNA